MARRAVGRSMMARRPRTITAPVMAPMAAAVTPSTRLIGRVGFRICGSREPGKL